METNMNTWQGLFFQFIFFGILSFLVFRLLGKVFPRYLQNTRWYINLMNYLPAIELGYWFLFLSWFTFAFAAINSFFGIITGSLLVILAYWISQFILKDLIAGMSVKLFRQINAGDKIEMEDGEATIQQLGWQNIICEKPDGTQLLLPFHKLSKYNVLRKDQSKLTGSFSFQVDIPIALNTPELSREIKAFIISLPASSIHQSPEVRLIDTNTDKAVFDITVFPIKRIYGNKIEIEVSEKFTKK